MGQTTDGRFNFELQRLIFSLGGELMTRQRLATLGGALLAALALTTSLHAAIIVDDSWADAGRDNGADPLDSNWWTSANANGIEVSAGMLGMVTGTSGRGIHTIFPTQTLANVGDKLTATYTFSTPATIGSGASAAFRVGLFDTLGRAGLNADVSASSGTPNAVYGLFSANEVGLPGYMFDMDVGTGSEDLNFRQLDAAVNVPAGTPTGRLMGTTTGFTSISPSGPDGAFAFAPNTTYTGSLMITRTSATEMQLTGTLGSASHSVTDTFDSDDFGMLAFWANSNVFGSSGTPNTADNGIDFTNVRIEFTPIPEPASMALGLAFAGALVARRRRRTPQAGRG
jgi:MYXO-CTERM domain-containing protein